MAFPPSSCALQCTSQCSGGGSALVCWCLVHLCRACTGVHNHKSALAHTQSVHWSGTSVGVPCPVAPQHWTAPLSRCTQECTVVHCLVLVCTRCTTRLGMPSALALLYKAQGGRAPSAQLLRGWSCTSVPRALASALLCVQLLWGWSYTDVPRALASARSSPLSVQHVLHQSYIMSARPSP